MGVVIWSEDKVKKLSMSCTTYVYLRFVVAEISDYDPMIMLWINSPDTDGEQDPIMATNIYSFITDVPVEAISEDYGNAKIYWEDFKEFFRYCNENELGFKWC